MKWIACYVVGALVVVTPVAVRFAMRSQQAAQPYAASDVDSGKTLFTRVWTTNDTQNGDGIGPVFNARSCVECHGQAGIGGAGGNEHNVTTFFRPANGNQKEASGVIHSFAINSQFQENLQMVDARRPPLVRPTLEQVNQGSGGGGAAFNQISFETQLSQRNTPALFGAALIDSIPDAVIFAQERSQKLRWHEPTGIGDTLPVGRALRLQGGAIGKFGWKGQNPSLLEFVQAACANELGLSNPGHQQPTPLSQVNYVSPGLDLTLEQCQEMAAFIANLKRPVEVVPADPQAKKNVENGKHLFTTAGCAECHVPNMGSVEGVYSDLLMHRMGSDLVGQGSYNGRRENIPESPGDDSFDTPMNDEWRTPPLWGVADSAPYLHDGRAPTLEDAIRRHDGQSALARDNFNNLSASQQSALVDFLKSLRAPN